MNFWIRNIATVHLGYSHSGPIKHNPWAIYSIIQLGDAWPELITQTDNFFRIEPKRIKNYHPLQVGDLIFRPRGSNHLSLLIEKHLPNTICARSLLVIRIHNQQEVLPGYVKWYINLPGTQKEIAALVNGKINRSISIRAIEGLELPVPTPEVQQLIVAEDAKTRLALQGAPWEKAALAQANAILLELVGDERLQAENVCE